MIFLGPEPRRHRMEPESVVEFDLFETDVRDAEPCDLEQPDPSEYADLAQNPRSRS